MSDIAPVELGASTVAEGGKMLLVAILYVANAWDVREGASLL